MAQVKILSDLELDKILQQKGSWSAIAFLQWDSIPCTHFRPEFDVFYAGQKEVFCGRIDVDENPSVAERLGIVAVPTVLLFKEGKEMGRWEGPYSHEALTGRVAEIIKAHRAGKKP